MTRIQPGQTHLPISDSSFYAHYDGFFGYYGISTHHPKHASIDLPSLPLLFQPAPKHEPCEVKVGCGATASGQPFLPTKPLDSPSLTGDHSPYIEAGQEQHFGISSMPRASTPRFGRGSMHRRHTQDRTAYPGYSMVHSFLTESHDSLHLLIFV
jgi:hypothetical protein